MPDPAPRPQTPPGLTRLWCAEGISSFGTYIPLYALQVLVVLDLGGTAADTGLLSAARSALIVHAFGSAAFVTADGAAARPVSTRAARRRFDEALDWLLVGMSS